MTMQSIGRFPRFGKSRGRGIRPAAESSSARHSCAPPGLSQKLLKLVFSSVGCGTLGCGPATRQRRQTKLTFQLQQGAACSVNLALERRADRRLARADNHV
jgi:hypothetical protein